MTVQIEHRVYKYETKTLEVVLPEQPLFFFKTGQRVAYGVFPIWTEWNQEQYGTKEEIWKYRIITVSNGSGKNSIDISEFQVSEIPRILGTKQSGFGSPAFSVCTEFIQPGYLHGRNYEQFKGDLDAVIQSVGDILQQKPPYDS